MEDDPPKAQFFFAESDEDSLGIADNKTDIPNSVLDQNTADGCGGSNLTQEEQSDLPCFSENMQVDGEVPAEFHEGTSGRSQSEENSGAQGFANANDSEDFPIDVVEDDDEPSGEIPDAPLNDSLDTISGVTRSSTTVKTNHLSDVSEDELDQLPRARESRSGDKDSHRFKNGSKRTSSTPTNSPPRGEAFSHGSSSHRRSKRAQAGSEESGSSFRKILLQMARRDLSQSPPPPVRSTTPRDDRRARLENLKKLNFPTKYKMKERIDDAPRGLSPPHGPSTPPYDNYESAPRRNVRSFLDEPGAEFLNVNTLRVDNSSGRNRSPDAGSRRKRRHADENERGDDRERSRGAWNEGRNSRGGRDEHADGLDNGLEDLSNNPAELQRRCATLIALSENQAAAVSDDQLVNAVTEAMFLLTNAQRLARKREKLLNEMKAMRQGEVDMMKTIHADLPPHLQSVVRIEGDNVYINESGLGGLPSSTNMPQFQQFAPTPVHSAVYLTPGPTPPVVGMAPFIMPPMSAMSAMVATKPSVPVLPPPIPPSVPPMPSAMHPPVAPVPEPSTISTVSASVSAPEKSESPEQDAGAESSLTSSFTNIPSFSHPPPPISSSSVTNATQQHVRTSSPGATIAGLPDFSKPPPPMRPVNGTSNGSLPKTSSSNALPDVAAVTSSRSNASVAPAAPSAPTPAAAPAAAVASSTVPPSAAPPLGFNVPPPNVASGSGTVRAPYMQPSSFLGPPPLGGSTSSAQDFTKTITSMITSALKSPASINAFGARPGIRSYVGPGMSLIGAPPAPSGLLPTSMLDSSSSSSGDVEWTNRRFQYRIGKSGYAKRPGSDRRVERQHDGTPRAFDSPK